MRVNDTHDRFLNVSSKDVYVSTLGEGPELCGESVEILPRLGLCGWVVVAVQMESADLWNQSRIYDPISMMGFERGVIGTYSLEWCVLSTRVHVEYPVA